MTDAEQRRVAHSPAAPAAGAGGTGCAGGGQPLAPGTRNPPAARARSLQRQRRRGRAISVPRPPVVTARTPVRKERSRGSAHAEVFSCRRNVWVLLPPHSWSADRHGWQNTALCSQGEALSGVCHLGSARPGLQCWRMLSRCSGCVQELVSQLTAPCWVGKVGWRWTLLHPVPRRVTPTQPRADLSRNRHKTLGCEPDQSQITLAIPFEGMYGKGEFSCEENGGLLAVRWVPMVLLNWGE